MVDDKAFWTIYKCIASAVEILNIFMNSYVLFNINYSKFEICLSSSLLPTEILKEKPFWEGVHEIWFYSSLQCEKESITFLSWSCI